METSDCMRAFLLLVLISAVHLSPTPTIGTKGGHVKFLGSSALCKANDCVLYRIHEDGDLLLVNCSQPDSPQPDGYNITCPTGEHLGFQFNDLAMSHTGDYRVEERRERGESRPVRVEAVYRLTVCEEGDVDLSKNDHYVYVRHGRVVMCEFDFALGKGTSLQLYGKFSLHLDTSSSLEPLTPRLKDKLQVDTNTSRVTLTGLMSGEDGLLFFCTMWRGGQCQKVRPQRLKTVPPVIVTHEKENVTLPCTFKTHFPEKVYWTTPDFGYVNISTSNQTRPQEVMMYMLNGSQSGNYSLIIPSVSHQHAGRYMCMRDNADINKLTLSVCVEFSPVNVTFSHGENVLMDSHVNDSETLLRAQWFCQKGLHPQMLIIEFINKKDAAYFAMNDVRMPEDLMGRVTVFNSGTSLDISSLRAKDSGVYTWRIIRGQQWGPWTKYFCYEGSIHLVYRDLYSDPFGVHSPFYRAYGPLMGCVLLGLVAAVIWLKLRSRGGALTPGGQEMEMQNIREDVYDDVEEAEDHV